MATIRDVRAVHTPQRAYMYEMKILARNEGRYTREDVGVYVKNLSLPSTDIEFVTTSFIGVKTHYPSKDSSPHTFTVTFWDDEKLTVYRFLKDWMDIMHDQIDGESNEKKDVVANIEISLKEVDDSKATGTLNLFNCFPNSLAEINLTYDSSEAMEISVTFIYDYKEFKKG